MSGPDLCRALLFTCDLGCPCSRPPLRPPSTAAPPWPHQRPLTNLAHLDFLTEQVAVSDTAGAHHLPPGGDRRSGCCGSTPTPGDGTFERVGGGPTTPHQHLAQGAYDADDIARAAVVYLRQWRATGDAREKQAYQQLRGWPTCRR